MLPRLSRISLVIILAITIGGALPLLQYWSAVGRVPDVTAKEAVALLSDKRAGVLLVDVRDLNEFNEGHVLGAESWPYAEIIALISPGEIPGRLQGKRLLLLCESGLRSSSATLKLRQDFGLDALNVAGGLDAWIAGANESGDLKVSFTNAAGEISPPPYKESPVYEQLALVAAVFMVKPLYMLLALALIIALWRFKSPDLTALRRGLVVFLAGETACAVNILAFDHGDYILEFFHSYGMMVGFGFFVYALLKAMDTRVVHWSDPARSCVLQDLCRQCFKDGAAYCKLERLLLFLLPALTILAFMPLAVSFHTAAYNTTVFNVFHHYSHPVVFQIFETRYGPMYAVTLLVIAFALLLLAQPKRSENSMVFLGAGAGVMGFSLLRTILVSLFQDNLVWFNFWEETTELMFVGAVALIWWTYRRELQPTQVLS